MKKGTRLIVSVSCMLVLCLALAGCSASDFLKEIPRDFTLIGNSSESVQLQEKEVYGQNSEASQPEILRESFLLEESDGFAYRSLRTAEAVWYRDMEAILGTFGEKVRLSGEGLAAGLSEKDIDRIFQCVLNDHPELFYVDGYSYVKYSRGDELTAVEFSGTYNVDYETALMRRSEIEAAADAALAGISQQASEYEKVKYVYEWVITSTDYDLEAPDNQNIYSVFVNHRSVCQGYAKATQYLLNRLGVECTLVLGNVSTGERHGWNLVQVDGSYYYVDTTWGDASYRMEEADDEKKYAMPEINYDYLNVTTSELLRTHTIDGVVPMPECVATEANYYVREGAIFTSYDRERMKELFDAAAAGGKTDVTIKCADDVCYREIASALIEGREIFSYLSGAGKSVAYAQNEKQLSLTFWVTNE